MGNITESEVRSGMIARTGVKVSDWAARWVPEPFVLTIVLTVLAMVGGTAYLASEHDVVWSLGKMLSGWMQGFQNKGGLAFSLQMALILVSGHAIATSSLVQRGVRRLAMIPQTSYGAVAMVVLVACLSALIHWGIGAIVGAFLAREIGRNAAESGKKFHYPLLGASAYLGMAVWHGGLSGSAPLKVAETGHLAADIVGVVPIDQTVFSALNIFVTGTVVSVLLGLFLLLVPKEESGIDSFAVPSVPKNRPSAKPISWTMWLQESCIPGRVVGVGGCGLALVALFAGWIHFDINAVNLVFIFVGIFLQGSLRDFSEAVAEGARGAGAIIIQFPFYFAILGVLRASGLVSWLSDGLADIAFAGTFPIVVFLSAGVLNLFVPSGGGQWGLQGPIVLSVGEQLGVDVGTTVMAFSYGDAWTNMLQPFWALPLLGIMGLRARDILGYTMIAFVAIGITVSAFLVLWS